MDKNKQAGITVFLTLVFLLILSMVGTMIEVSRYQICKGHTWRTLECAACSLFSEYNRPLYDEYRLFLIEDEGEPFEQTISSYMNDTLQPQVGKTIDMYDGSLLGVDIKNKQYAADNEGEAVFREITEFMEKKVRKDILSKLLGQNKQTSDVEQAAAELKVEVEEQEEASELDLSTLELMKLIDGVQVSSGNISVVKDFVKMVAPEKKSASELGIHHPTVWQTISSEISTLQEEMKHPAKFCEKLKRLKKVTKQAIQAAKEMELEYRRINKHSQGLDSYYKKMNTLLYGKAGEAALVDILEGNAQIIEQTLMLLEKERSDDFTAEINQLWKNYCLKPISFDYSGLMEKGGNSNPKEILGDVLSDSLLNLVVKEPDKISKGKVSTPDYFAKMYRGNEKSETDHEGEIDYQGRLSDFFHEDKADFTGVFGKTEGNIADKAAKEVCFGQYIKTFFGNYNRSIGTMKKKLKYEMEYILCGKDSDKENLTSVAERLLLLRSIANLITITKDSSKRNQAYIEAVGIVGFTGMEPLIRLTQTLLLIVWGMEEGLVDVAALLQGKEVPLIKTSAQIQVSSAELLLVNREFIQKKVNMGFSQKSSKGSKSKKDTKPGILSLSYDDYLRLFTMAQSRKVKLYRLMDLIQWNISGNYSEGFQLSNCVYAIYVNCSVQYETKFFRMAAIEKMLGRSLKQYQHTAELMYQYGK